MNTVIREFDSRYSDQLTHLFDDFQDYLVELDPLKRLRRMPGYGENALGKTLKEADEYDGIFYVALDNEKVIGFASGIVEKVSKDDLLGVIPSTPGRITELYVRADYRGSGIGTELMERMEAYLKEKGCDVVKVEAFAPNTQARHLYSKLGYETRDITSIKKLL